MISQCQAIRLLQHERVEWKKENNGAGLFTQGVIFGLTLAMTAIEELGRYTQGRMKDNPKYIGILARRGK